MTLKRYLSIFSLLLPFFCTGQVIITPLNGDGALLQLEQLYQLAVSNASGADIQGVLSLKVEGQDFLTVLEQRTLPLTLPAGATLSGAQVAWEGNPRFGSSAAAQSVAGTGSFPSGEYVFCYEFKALSTGALLGVHCQERRVGLNGQFELIAPYDTEEVAITNPLLSWEQLWPAEPGWDVRYHLRLVELRGGQSPIEALGANPPLLDQPGIASQFLLYPAGGIPLVPGRAYAWQVTASVDGTLLTRSSAWRFTMAAPQRGPTPPPAEENSYCLLADKLGSTYYLANRQLCFAFNNREELETLPYEIYAISGERDTLRNLPLIRLKPGLNTIDISAEQLPGLAPGQEYLLVATIPEEQHLYLRFLYREP